MINYLKKFFLLFTFLFLLSPIVYLVISATNDKKRTDYPGKEIARLVQNKWDENFINEIRIVVGDEWYAGNLSYHLVSRPKWTNELKNEEFNDENERWVIIKVAFSHKYNVYIHILTYLLFIDYNMSLIYSTFFS